MATAPKAAWGIDIGQAGLKALKVVYDDTTDKATAVAFDYVEHPKILSQPDAIPEELIPQAIQTFLSRNDVGTDLVAISTPNKQSFARFIGLPPTPRKNVDKIVGFEAKQQIPFPLDDVFWDYQMIGTPVEAGDLLIDAEVALFAMKKNEVYQRLEPFQTEKVEVELVQPTSVALYNMLAFNEMGFRPGGSDLDGSEDYFIVLDMGCDDTTMIITNGSKIAIRSVRIGGNHFTRALVKELKLSFAKAEHLKINATKAPDPKSVFQALRPVFNDFVQEIQRSVGNFANTNRTATISKVFGLGNGFKLAGLQKFLQQNLDYEVVRPDTLESLGGDSIVNSPLFQENVLTFPVSYGLALQALGAGKLTTSLLPPEIATARIIRRKKPWAAAAAATLLAGLSGAMLWNGLAYNSVSRPGFVDAIAAANTYKSEVTKGEGDYSAQKSAFTAAKEVAPSLVEGRRDTTWLEVYDSINAALPRDEVDASELPPNQRQAVSVTSVTSSRVADVATWYEALEGNEEDGKTLMPPPFNTTPPESGPGYVFTLTGTSWYYDKDDYNMQKHDYVFNTLVKNLTEWQIVRDGQTYPIRQLGFSHPVLVSSETEEITYEPRSGRDITADSRITGGGVIPQRQPAPGQDEDKSNNIFQTKFRVEFVWKPAEDGVLPEVDPLAEEVAEGDAAAGDDPEL